MDEGASQQLVGWLLVLVLILGAGSALGYAVIRWVKAWTASEDVGGEGGFTLQNLRDWRDRGEITAVEYEAMRARILGRESVAAPTEPADDDSPEDSTS